MEEDSSDDCDFILDNGESTAVQEVSTVTNQPQNNENGQITPSV